MTGRRLARLCVTGRCPAAGFPRRAANTSLQLSGRSRGYRPMTRTIAARRRPFIVSPETDPILPLPAQPRLRYLTVTSVNASISAVVATSAAWLAWMTLLAAEAVVKKGQRHALFGRDGQFWVSSPRCRSSRVTGRKTDIVTASVTGMGSGSCPMRAANAAVSACRELGPIETAAPIAW